MISDFTKWVLRFKRFGGNRQGQTIAVPRDRSVMGFTPSGSPVLWPGLSIELAGHTIVLGLSGDGKTVMVSLALVGERLIYQGEVDEVVHLVNDCKGDLTNLLLQGLAAHCPQSLANVHYLNPFQGGFPFNLNKLMPDSGDIDIRSARLADLVTQVGMGMVDERTIGAGLRQTDVLHHLILATLASTHPLSNILWAYDALTLADGMKRLAKITSSRRARQFLESTKLSPDLKDSCAARLRFAFSLSDRLESIVAGNQCIQFERLLSPGSTTIIDVGSPVGGYQNLQTFWANLLPRLMIEYLMSRPSPWNGHHCRIIMDEAQVVAPVLSDAAVRIFTEGRSRGISLTLCTQGTAPLQAADATLLPTLLSNTPNKFVGRLNAKDAEIFARELTTRPGIDETLESVRRKFIAKATNLGKRKFMALRPGSQAETFTSADVDLPAWRRAADHYQTDIEAVKNRYALRDGIRRIRLQDVTDSIPNPRGSRPRVPRSNQNPPDSTRPAGRSSEPPPPLIRKRGKPRPPSPGSPPKPRTPLG